VTQQTPCCTYYLIDAVNMLLWPCRPSSLEAGPEVVPPFNETWAAMESLVDRGLVRSIGVSNFSPEKIQTLLKTARIRPAVNQVRLLM